MKIVGFGDSFIEGAHESWPGNDNYLAKVGRHLNASVETHGFGGSGSWDAFFQFEKYMKQELEHVDIVIFAWSEPSRLYHPHVRNLCPHGSSLPRDKNDPDAAIWLAAKQYYAELYDHHKTESEASAFYQWVDILSTNYADTKFIHMWSFAKDVTRKLSWWDMYDEDQTTIEYHHHFKNGAEIRPALMNFSRREGWPKGNDTPNDPRQNHMTPKYHTVLSSIIIDAIENYEPGVIFTEKKI